MFDPIWKLSLGLVTGIVFGFLLQKGRVTKSEVIVGQFLGRDFTVVKVMASAVIVGSIGVYALLPLELFSLSVKPLLWSGIILGGMMFGIGMSVLGYCPGTGVAACGEGKIDALFGFFGMLAGAGLYVFNYNSMSQLQKWWGDYGKKTLPELTHTSPWIWISSMAVFGIILAILFRSNKRNFDGHSIEIGYTKK